MNDFEDQDDEQEESQEPSGQDAGFRKRLERDAQRSKAEATTALAEAAVAKRETAFLKAGVDVESPLGKMFTKGYEGELSVEAIKTQASLVGLIPTSESPEVKNSMAGAEQVSNASQGAPASAPQDFLDEIAKLNVPGNWSEKAVLDLARRLGSSIDEDREYQFINPSRLGL